MMTGTEAVDYIHSVSWLGSRPGLDRIRELVSLIGNPERGMRFIHVAGTNGKGSVCAMLEKILRHSGYRTGLFTSPYVVHFNERIRVNGDMIGDDALGEVTEYVKSFADSMKESPTEFELLTAIAFEHFKREACDVVVLETGLGGRLDSTNVIESPVLSVITGIALDHTSVLGDTVEKIAMEKSGIIKRSRPVVFGGGSDEALEVIKNVASENGSQLYISDRTRVSFEYSSLAGSEFVFDNVTKINLSLIGEYQIDNAVTVLTAIDALRDSGMNVLRAAVKYGLETVQWPARFELLSRSPLIIYDGAHNPQGVSALVKNIRRFFNTKPVVALVGVMADKDHSFMTGCISSVACRVHTVTPNNPRAMSASDLAAEFTSAGVESVAHECFDSAVAAAVADAERIGAPVVALGSLYMYADVSDSVRRYVENL